jgi:hypothetical protein
MHQKSAPVQDGLLGSLGIVYSNLALSKATGNQNREEGPGKSLEVGTSEPTARKEKRS